jgi:membrane associated rhomboid family serine protease
VFFLPIGHDQTIYERPWVTLGIVAACVLVFVPSYAIDLGASSRIEDAAMELEGIAMTRPEARVHADVVGLPPEVYTLIAPILDPNGVTGVSDPELERALAELVAAINAMPSFRFGYRPAEPTVHGAIGHLFMHGGIFHLLGNMWFLFLAGIALESFWNRFAFAGLYLLCGLGGALAHHLAHPESLIPLVGASGAISGLLGAFVVGHFKVKIRVFYFIWVLRPLAGVWNIPSWFAIPAWIGVDLLYALFGLDTATAYWAHVGGFGVGVVIALAGRFTRLIAREYEGPV